MILSPNDPKKMIKGEVILFFGSRRLSEGESRYSAYKLELVGLTYALNHFRFILLGKKFLVRTDHKALEWLTKTKNPKTPALCYRWQSLLSEFDFDIEYVPGRYLKLVNALSRRPYKAGDTGNIIPLLPKRDRLWDDEFDIDHARNTIDDDFWIPVMQKKFGEAVKKEPRAVASTTVCQRIPAYLKGLFSRGSLDVCALEGEEEPSTTSESWMHMVSRISRHTIPLTSWHKQHLVIQRTTFLHPRGYGFLPVRPYTYPRTCASHCLQICRPKC